jgi:hypothetical protein
MGHAVLLVRGTLASTFGLEGMGDGCSEIEIDDGFVMIGWVLIDLGFTLRN